MNTFQIQLAGKIIELSAQYPYLLTYCSEYLVTGTPDLSIAVQPADIAFEREKSRREDLRELKICSISDKLDIAAFILFSDVELTEACAKELAARVPACDYILTAESKGIPLAYEMSRQLGVPYIVARKSVKGYMTDVLSVQVKSITTAAVQTLYLDGDKAAWMRGKRILVVDDVVSTGDSLRALHQLAFSVPQTAMPAKSILSSLILVVDDLAKQEHISGEKDGDYVSVEGELEGSPYLLRLSAGGELAGFEMDNMDTEYLLGLEMIAH